MPQAQYRVNLNNGNYTIADYAWVEHRLLIFIDGTSEKLHGNPQTAQMDKLKRIQAEMQNWKVIAITYQELFDEPVMALRLQQIESYLRS